jgi:ketosteroid isomerase-like protein
MKENRSRQAVTMVVAVLVLLTAGSVAPARADSTEAAVSAIRQIWVNYAAYVESGDSTAWLLQYDTQGIQMRPDSPARARPDLDAFILASFKARMAGFDTNMSIAPLEISVVGDWAYSRGVFTQDMTAKETKKIAHFEGKFLTIFKKQDDGGWKIYRDCFNSNLPPAK